MYFLLTSLLKAGIWPVSYTHLDVYKRQDQKDVDAYFTFLKDGAHHFPIEQLRMAGCDMTDPKTVDSALAVFVDLVDKIEAIETL